MTDQVPTPAPQPATPAPAYAPAPANTNPWNVLSIVSLVASLVGFGIVGIITGHIALGQIKTTGAPGRGVALAGLIVGYAYIAFALIFVVIYAIIAPLSVHSASGGMRSWMPASAQRSAASSRTRALATTPPPSRSLGTPRSAHAATALVRRMSTTASRKLAATSATGTSRPSSRSRSTQRATAVLRPENEKS